MTALVYLAIIALWALFLIPWLGRQRDEQSGRRSGERYNTAMRELRNRHSHRHDANDVETAPEPSEFPEWDEAGSGGTLWDGLGSRISALRPGVGERGSQTRSAARRRRTVLLAITASLLVSGLGFGAGILPLPVPVLCAFVLVAYLAALAAQAQRSRAAGPGSAADNAHHREAARLAHEQAQRMMGGGRSTEQPSASSWDAQPTHVPSYARQQRAAKAPRVTDLRGDETLTGQDLVTQAQEQKRREARKAQEQFEREMAVVEPDVAAEVARMANPVDIEPYRRAANG